MKTVAFYQPFMNERGTCVAMFDYAYFNQTLLGNKSLFFYDSLDTRNEEKGLERIRNSFDLIDIRCADHNIPHVEKYRNKKLDDTIAKTNTDYLYICKSGYNDGIVASNAKTVIQAVGMVPPSERHGTVWAYVSYFSSRACSNGTIPVVPYMVNLPEETGNLRLKLDIPETATVFGRYGGLDTFDNWANSIIQEVLNERPDAYFLFMNTPKTINHNRVIYMDSTTDLNEKVKFINTCDAMLHVRWVGETFGAACAEFSTKGKPVITDSRSPERNHIEILGDKGIYFDSPDRLKHILLEYRINTAIDWNCYKEYTPEKIMKIFDSVYLI